MEFNGAIFKNSLNEAIIIIGICTRHCLLRIKIHLHFYSKETRFSSRQVYYNATENPMKITAFIKISNESYLKVQKGTK